jgi:glucose-6-phosphate dehydrogenase assembly protein OpcA
MNSAIQPEAILRDLTELWVTLGKENDGDSSAGVLRACAMTLVATAEEGENPGIVGETLAALVREHPSRAIVIRFRPSTTREVSARVFAQCWMPFGQRRQICCEQIEITATEASLSELPPVILPLTVSDLPIILWCRSWRLFRLADFPALAQVAPKIIVDSTTFPDPAEILPQLASWAIAGQMLGDLAWTRLTRWRELVAQVFENKSYLCRLQEVTEVRITHGGPSPPSMGYYLAAWLQDCLEKAGASAQVQWQAEQATAAGELRQVELVAPGKNAMRVSIRMAGDRNAPVAELDMDSMISRTAFPAANDYVLLREELSIPGRDPVFDSTLIRAVRLVEGPRPS